MRSAGITGQALTAARAGAVVVTANTRAARNLRLHYALAQDREGRGAWPSAQIHSWRAWTKQLWQEWLLGAEGEVPVLLDVGQEAQLWQQAIAAGGPGTAPGMYLPAAATLAARAWRLAWHYGLPLDHSAFRARPDSEAFRAWAQAFQKKCQQNRWLDGARLPGFLQRAIAAGEIAVPAQLLLVGFDEITPQQAALLGAAAARGMAWSEAAPAPAGSAVCVAAPETADEIAAAARWARRLLEAEPAARIAVVVPELDGLRSRVERAFLEALQPQALAITSPAGRRPFDISLGRPLAAYPVIAAALLALRLAQGPVTSADAGRFLRSLFFWGAEEEFFSRARLDARLRRRGRVEVTLGDIINAAHRCPQLARTLGRLNRARRALPATASPSQWARLLSRLLLVLSWPGPRPPTSEEQQTLERWRRLLSDFARLGLVRPSVTAAEAVALLAEMAGRQIFQPENEAAPVQILGMLEAAGSEFDHMWVMGMHDGAWPTSARPDPFLPFALQRECGVPSASPQAQLEAARRITERLRASAGEVVFSYPTSDGDNALRLSPLLVESDILHAGLADGAPVSGASWAQALFDPKQIETLCDETGPAFTAGAAPGGTRLFKLQSDCPFRAFAELRLGARELDAPEPGLDPRRRGTVIHYALQYVWEALGDRDRLLAAQGEERERLIADCVKRALDKGSSLGDTSWEQRFREMEHARLVDLVGDWLRLEEGRAAFRVLAQEREMPVSLGGLTVTIKADRVDELVPGGGRVVIDYKTGAGAPKAKSWETERPNEPQLPIYAATMEADLAAVAFAHVRRGDPKFSGHARGEGLIPGVKAHPEAADSESLEKIVAEWRRVLEQLAAGFRAGEATVHPRDGAKTCQYCPLPSLCRIRELEPLRWKEEVEGNGGGESDGG